MEELATEFNNTKTQWDTNDIKREVRSWFLMSSPFGISVLMIIYWLFVLKLGPLYMKNRKPFDINRYLVAYNIFQVLVSFYLVGIGKNIMHKYGFFPSICSGENPIDGKLEITRGVHTFMLSKLVELLDTVFFVLKKNNHQISFLHVYHHSITIIACWVSTRLDSVNFSAPFLGTANAFVHIVMYAYYSLSAIPGMNKYLWWKKYITALQLTQFLLITLHHFISYKVAKCEKFNVIFLTLIINLLLFIYLFADFYVKTYIRKSTSITKLSSNTDCKGGQKIAAEPYSDFTSEVNKKSNDKKNR